MAVDRARIRAAVSEILAAIGEDPERAGLQSTPRRVADAYSEFFAGLDQDPQNLLQDCCATASTKLGPGKSPA